MVWLGWLLLSAVWSVGICLLIIVLARVVSSWNAFIGFIFSSTALAAVGMAWLIMSSSLFDRTKQSYKLAKEYEIKTVNSMLPVTDSKTKVKQVPTQGTKTRQKRSTKLSESKVWRFFQVIYGVFSVVVIFTSAAVAIQPTCTGGYGGSLSYYGSPRTCTYPDDVMSAIAALVALASVVIVYYLLEWTVKYIMYGPGKD
jgi:hypothetical protein